MFKLYNYFSFKLFIIFSLFILFLIGVINYLIKNEPNKCEMTYMFQKPEYIPINLGSEVNELFPTYNLYSYGEGHYAETLRLGHYDGMPVLFVPGHGGSYKQARSLASVALRMSQIDYHFKYHFDYFTIDFNQELSAFDGNLLFIQTKFLNEAIKAVLKIYKQNQKLVLIGHSIGGILCRAVLTLNEFEHIDRINLIITLATPHIAPVLPLDSQILKFYQMTNSEWISKRNESLSHINIISIGGGHSDKLVRSDLTKLPTTHPNDFSSILTSIEDVWLSTDHVCIVWCKQLIIKLNRLLFDYANKNIKNQSIDIIKYHLMNRKLDKNYPNYHVKEFEKFFPNDEWKEIKDRHFRFSKNKILNPLHYLFPLNPRESFVINYSGNLKYDWLFVCNSTKVDNMTYCDTGFNLYNRSKLMPSHSRSNEKRLFKITSLTYIKQGCSHLLISLTANFFPVSIIVDRFTTSIRTKTIDLPNLIQNFKTLFFPKTLFEIHISDQSSFYDLNLHGIEQVWNIYSIELETKSCYSSAKEMGYLYLSFPWSNENQYKLILPQKNYKTKLLIRPNNPKPENSSLPHLYIITDPDCGYHLLLKSSISEICGQVFRFCGTLLFPIIVSILISTCSYQLSVFHNIKIKNSQYLLNNLMYDLKYITIYGFLIFASIGFTFLSNNVNLKNILNLSFSQTIILYIFLFGISYSLAFLIVLSLTFFYNLLTNIIINIKLKIESLRFSSAKKKFNRCLEPTYEISYFSIFLAVLMCFISFVFNTSLSMLIGLIFHHIFLLKLFINYRERENRIGFNPLSFLLHMNILVLVLMYFSLLPTSPVLIEWIKSNLPIFKYGFMNIYSVSSLVQSISFGIFWQQYYENSLNRFERKIYSLMLRIIAIIIITYGQINFSLIPGLISLSFFIISVCNVLSWYRKKSLKRE